MVEKLAGPSKASILGSTSGRGSNGTWMCMVTIQSSGKGATTVNPVRVKMTSGAKAANTEAGSLVVTGQGRRAGQTWEHPLRNTPLDGG